jgi:hypothetical protein
MKTVWALRGLKIVFFVALVALALSFVVMSLWNWLMPALFGLRMISFWQAMGLLVLSKILLGGFRGRPGGGMHWRRRMMERWEQMTPEEREKFRQGMRGRCGPFEPPAAAPKT